MDIICTRCGEPLALDHVLHDEPDAFKRRGGRIDRCPCCERRAPKLSGKEQQRLNEVRLPAELLGDDVDGLAATLEDFDLVR